MFEALLFPSPVQMMPSCDHTGTPVGLEGFFHFASSTASGSASWISARMRPSIPSRQSPFSSIVASFEAAGGVFWQVTVRAARAKGKRSRRVPLDRTGREALDSLPRGIRRDSLLRYAHLAPGFLEEAVTALDRSGKKSVNMAPSASEGGAP